MLKKLLFSAGLASVLFPAQGAVLDAYGPLIQWRQAASFEVTPIHVALLPTGDLFFINEFNLFFYPGVDLTAPGFRPEFSFLMRPTPATEAPPSSVVIQPLPDPPALQPSFDSAYARFKSTVCGGHALLANGDLFFASGSEGIIDRARYASGDLVGSLAVDGIAESFTFHTATQGWTQNPSTIIPGTATGRPLRWYASVTRLSDSRMLVAGGYERVLPTPSIFNPSVEVFDPRTSAWSAVSGTQETPAGMENPDYTHIFEFPNAQRPGTVLVIGGSGEPMYLSLTGKAPLWHRTGSYRPGAKEHINASAPYKVFPNKGSSSALLPLRLPEGNWGYSNGSVLYAGGAHGTPGNGNVDIYDAGSDIWRPSIPMRGLRHHPSTVLLPDGRVLILAGFDDMSGMSKTGFAEYVDPRNNFALAQGTAEMPEVRGYHTVTVLLPDGRVLLGSGNVDGNDGREHDNFRYYFPDYMTKARPTIASAPESISVGSHAFISVPHRTTVGEVALVGLGSQTHSFDLNQRHVQLRSLDLFITVRLVAGQWMTASAADCAGSAQPCFDLHAIQAPPSAQTAPPGHYMLFVLDGNRVPSTAKMLRLDASQGVVPAPGLIDFGGQSMHTTARLPVSFTNTGATTIFGISVAVAAPFAVTHDCGTLASGASCQATVEFTPATEGLATGKVTFTAAGGASTQVALLGLGERSLVTHYYQSILRRSPDAAGEAFWNAEAGRVAGLGANLNETWYAMTQSFFSSAEYLAFGRDVPGYVTDLYTTFFNRAPDLDGRDYWTGLIAQGLPREMVLLAFMFSPEFSAFTRGIFGDTAARAEVDTVVDFYRGILSRLPDSSGFAFWAGRFRSAQCLGAQQVYAEVESISSAFINSTEYFGRNRNAPDFVGDMYNSFLRRGGDLAGVQYWIGQLTSGARTRDDVRRAFISSPEFEARVARIVAESCSR